MASSTAFSCLSSSSRREVAPLLLPFLPLSFGSGGDAGRFLPANRSAGLPSSFRAAFALKVIFTGRFSAVAFKAASIAFALIAIANSDDRLAGGGLLSRELELLEEESESLELPLVLLPDELREDFRRDLTRASAAAIAFRALPSSRADGAGGF